jgi:hypothetical protein
LLGVGEELLHDEGIGVVRYIKASGEEDKELFVECYEQERRKRRNWRLK